MPNTLAIDTAMNACAVAVKRSDGQLFQHIEFMERGQSEYLLPLILEIVGQAGITLQDIDQYAVTTGPGTFTGLRVGLATVRALSQASGKPAIGIGTFDAISDDPNTCIILETKRTDFYVRAPGHDDACMSPDDLASILKPEWSYIGDALVRANITNGTEIKSIPLDRLIAVAEKTPASGLPDPVYLRGADVSATRKKAVKIV